MPKSTKSKNSLVASVEASAGPTGLPPEDKFLDVNNEISNISVTNVPNPSCIPSLEDRLRQEFIAYQQQMWVQMQQWQHAVMANKQQQFRMNSEQFQHSGQGYYPFSGQLSQPMLPLSNMSQSPPVFSAVPERDIATNFSTMVSPPQKRVIPTNRTHDTFAISAPKIVSQHNPASKSVSRIASADVEFQGVKNDARNYVSADITAVCAPNDRLAPARRSFVSQKLETTKIRRVHSPLMPQQNAVEKMKEVSLLRIDNYIATGLRWWYRCANDRICVYIHDIKSGLTARYSSTGLDPDAFWQHDIRVKDPGVFGLKGIKACIESGYILICIGNRVATIESATLTLVRIMDRWRLKKDCSFYINEPCNNKPYIQVMTSVSEANMGITPLSRVSRPSPMHQPSAMESPAGTPNVQARFTKSVADKRNILIRKSVSIPLELFPSVSPWNNGVNKENYTCKASSVNVCDDDGFDDDYVDDKADNESVSDNHSIKDEADTDWSSNHQSSDDHADVNCYSDTSTIGGDAEVDEQSDNYSADDCDSNSCDTHTDCTNTSASTMDSSDSNRNSDSGRSSVNSHTSTHSTYTIHSPQVAHGDHDYYGNNAGGYYHYQCDDYDGIPEFDPGGTRAIFTDILQW